MTAAARPAKPVPHGMSGSQKAAILCMALGAESSARVFKHLSPVEVEQVSREIARTKSVGPEVVDSVLGEYNDVRLAVQSIAEGGLDYARQILESALGQQRSKAVVERIQEQLTERGLNRLKRAPPDVLMGVLRGESPQTLALVLAYVEPKLAAGVIQGMDPTAAAEVLYRIARMEKVAPEILELVESGIGTRSDLSLSQETTASGGPSVVARLLNQVPGPVEKVLLDAMNRRSSEVADSVRELMFVFEDLVLLDARAMQRLLRDVESRELARALKAASEELKALILKNMSERAGAALQEEIEMLGAVKVRDVETAHGNIVKLVRDLQAAGEIEIERAGDDAVIA